MKLLVFALRAFYRQIRSGEVVVLIVAISLAVASLTAVGFLTDRISTSIERQANELLAADLRIRSPEEIPATWIEIASEQGLDVALSQSFPTVIYAGSKSALATIKAVSKNYPLRGKVRISKTQYGDEYVAHSIPNENSVWVDSALLSRLKAKIGDFISIGNNDFKIDAVLRYRPDQSIGFASLAPSILVNLAAIPSTNLITEGSRVNYSLLLAGEEQLLEDYTNDIAGLMSESARISDRSDSNERTNQAINRSQQFLSMTAIISILLSAIAIAMSARRFMKRRMDTVALMKSLGAKKQFVVNVMSLQLIMIGLVGVVLGCIMGFVVENTVSNILAELFSGELPKPSLKPLKIGFLAAFILLPGFAFPSLLQLCETSPLRVLRRDSMPPPPSQLLIGGTAVVAIGLLLYYLIGDAYLLSIIMIGTITISFLLYVVGRLLVSLLSRMRGNIGAAWRYGLANISRRGRESAIQIVAFGLGITVLLLLSFIRNDLLEGWQETLDENTPNYFLINIQPEQTPEVEKIFKQNNIASPDFVPLVRARMSFINDTNVKSMVYPDERGKWMANREANLSWSNSINTSNKLVKGSWWSEDYAGIPLVSVEEGAAQDMGVSIGDTLTFLVAGEEVKTTIANIRQVDWNSFQPNFFMVLSSNALESFPMTFITSLRLDNDKSDVLSVLSEAFPTISIIDLEPILQQVRQIIEKVSLAIQIVFIFTMAAGVTVLFSAVHSTIDERRFESALLRAVGMKKRMILMSLLSEFAAIGLAAGLLAATGSSILAWQIAERLFDLQYVFSFSLWLKGLLGGLLLVCVSGYFATRVAIKSPPIIVLRNN